MISLHYTSHTKAYNTYYAQCDIVEQSTPLQPARFVILEYYLSKYVSD